MQQDGAREIDVMVTRRLLDWVVLRLVEQSLNQSESDPKTGTQWLKQVMLIRSSILLPHELCHFYASVKLRTIVRSSSRANASSFDMKCSVTHLKICT